VRDHVLSMSERPPSDVLGALPHTRPHRRSDKRKSAAAATTPKTTPKAAATTPKTTAAKRPATTKATAKATTREAPVRAARRPRPERLRQPAQPEGTPDAHRSKKPPANGIDLVGTAVQAAAELAEIGISMSARAIRTAVSRLPRP
jgi:hypothetical protein